MIELIPTSWSDFWPYAPGMLVAGFYLCLAPLLPRRKTWARLLVAAVCLAVAVRYLVWRLLYTLLPAELMSGVGVWYLGIYVVELFAFLNYAIFYLILSRWVDRSSEADHREADYGGGPWRCYPASTSSFRRTTKAQDVLHRTILAAWESLPQLPGLGARRWRARLARRILRRDGAYYITRSPACQGRESGPALSVTAAICSRSSTPTLPRAKLPYRTVRLFGDPRIGVSEPPEHFFNPDPIQLNLGLSTCCRTINGCSSRSWRGP